MASAGQIWPAETFNLSQKSPNPFFLVSLIKTPLEIYQFWTFDMPKILNIIRPAMIFEFCPPEIIFVPWRFCCKFQFELVVNFWFITFDFFFSAQFQLPQVSRVTAWQWLIKIVLLQITQVKLGWDVSKFVPKQLSENFLVSLD